MAYTEADIRAKLIDPEIKSSDWLESHIVREYYFTDGRKLIGGARGKQYYVDYLLTYENTNLAIIEAKAENKDPLAQLHHPLPKKPKKSSKTSIIKNSKLVNRCVFVENTQCGTRIQYMVDII